MLKVPYKNGKKEVHCVPLLMNAFNLCRQFAFFETEHL